jgi:hypothetical protein
MLPAMKVAEFHELLRKEAAQPAEKSGGRSPLKSEVADS